MASTAAPEHEPSSLLDGIHGRLDAIEGKLDLVARHQHGSNHDLIVAWNEIEAIAGRRGSARTFGRSTVRKAERHIRRAQADPPATQVKGPSVDAVQAAASKAGEKR